MKYQITHKEVKEADVSGETQLAIETYKKILITEKRLVKLEKELSGWLSEIPSKDLNVYIEITNELAKEYEK